MGHADGVGGRQETFGPTRFCVLPTSTPAPAFDRTLAAPQTNAEFYLSPYPPSLMLLTRPLFITFHADLVGAARSSYCSPLLLLDPRPYDCLIRSAGRSLSLTDDRRSSHPHASAQGQRSSRPSPTPRDFTDVQLEPRLGRSPARTFGRRYPNPPRALEDSARPWRCCNSTRRRR